MDMDYFSFGLFHLRACSWISCTFGRQIWDAMRDAKRAVQLCCTSDLQRRSAPKVGESNVHVICEQALRGVSAGCSFAVILSVCSVSIALLWTPHSLAYCLTNLFAIISNPNGQSRLKLSWIKKASKSAKVHLHRHLGAAGWQNLVIYSA